MSDNGKVDLALKPGGDVFLLSLLGENKLVVAGLTMWYR